MAKKANQKPASGAKPAGENTCGVILPKTACAPTGAQTQGLAPTHEASYWEREERIAQEMDKPKTMAAHWPGILGLLEIFGGRGRGPQTARQAAMPKAKPSTPANQAAEPGKPAAKEPPPVTASGANGANGGGGGYSKKVKRKPGRRCELVPYDELQCDKGQEAHHVVPDWMLRTGKRGVAGQQLPDMPSLAKGPAICLEKGAGEEHSVAHKHTDKVAQRVGRSGKARGAPGTIQLGQAKAISARAIEKSTGGPAKGGCSRKDIQQQLDEQFKAPDSAKVRAVKDARKVTDEIRDAVTKTTRKR